MPIEILAINDNPKKSSTTNPSNKKYPKILVLKIPIFWGNVNNDFESDLISTISEGINKHTTIKNRLDAKIQQSTKLIFWEKIAFNSSGLPLQFGAIV